MVNSIIHPTAIVFAVALNYLNLGSTGFFAQQEDPNILLLESKRKEERHEPVDPENYEGVAIAMPTPKK